jgi:hypothetical protein
MPKELPKRGFSSRIHDHTLGKALGITLPTCKRPPRFRTIQVARALYPPEMPMAQALLGEHLIPAAGRVRQIGLGCTQGLAHQCSMPNAADARLLTVHFALFTLVL